jgi:hypothetical protein
MKNFIYFIVAMFVTATASAQFNVCNVEITNVSVSGSVGFGEGGLDTSEACIEISGTADLCNSDGETIASGLTLTLSSGGCDKSELLQGKSMSSGEIFMPFELLGEQPQMAGTDIPIVYPNPSSQGFTLKTKREINSDQIKVYDFKGNVVSADVTRDTNEGYKISLKNNLKGNYILKFVDGETNFSQQLIVK